MNDLGNDFDATGCDAAFARNEAYSTGDTRNYAPLTAYWTGSTAHRDDAGTGAYGDAYYAIFNEAGGSIDAPGT